MASAYILRAWTAWRIRKGEEGLMWWAFERACSQIPLARHRLHKTPVCAIFRVNISADQCIALSVFADDLTDLAENQVDHFSTALRGFIPGMGFLHGILFFRAIEQRTGRVLEGSGNCRPALVTGREHGHVYVWNVLGRSWMGALTFKSSCRCNLKGACPTRRQLSGFVLRCNGVQYRNTDKAQLIATNWRATARTLVRWWVPRAICIHYCRSLLLHLVLLVAGGR